MSATIDKNPIFPAFISILLVIALGISLAKLLWMIVTPEQELVLVAEESQVASINPKKATNYGKLIADQNIFGKVVVKKTPVKTEPKKVEIVKPVVPKVKLNAKLHGIVAYESQNSFALISNNNSRQKVYAIGETLQEGVTINKILPTKVLVDNNGTIEELLLPKKIKTSSNRSNQRANSNSANNASLPQARNPQTNGGPDLNQFRQEILTNPAKLSDIVRASPAIKNGEFIGFRIRSGKNRKLFRQLKFRANDIITEVNGILLNDANKGIEVLAQLETATNLAIKVKRGNQEIFIDHAF